ncbi:MAG: hypothetical protein JWN84_1743 [Nocardioides sp.]|nr:hypothetical protein [Nocardioides sp.]
MRSTTAVVTDVDVPGGDPGALEVLARRGTRPCSHGLPVAVARSGPCRLVRGAPSGQDPSSTTISSTSPRWARSASSELPSGSGSVASGTSSGT